MSEADARGSAHEGGEQVEELVDHGRRETLTRLAKYAAPAMLAVLLSVERGGAQMICVSNCPA
jgi:hypothetical protein